MGLRLSHTRPTCTRAGPAAAGQPLAAHARRVRMHAAPACTSRQHARCARSLRPHARSPRPHACSAHSHAAPARRAPTCTPTPPFRRARPSCRARSPRPLAAPSRLLRPFAAHSFSPRLFATLARRARACSPRPRPLAVPTRRGELTKNINHRNPSAHREKTSVSWPSGA